MWRFLTLGICLFFLTACGRVSVQEQQAYVFGTRVEVLVVGDDPALGRQAITSVLQEFDRLHRVYHAWQESELTALNSAIFDGRPQQAAEMGRSRRYSLRMTISPLSTDARSRKRVGGDV